MDNEVNCAAGDSESTEGGGDILKYFSDVFTNVKGKFASKSSEEIKETKELQKTPPTSLFGSITSRIKDFKLIPAKSTDSVTSNGDANTESLPDSKTNEINAESNENAVTKSTKNLSMSIIEKIPSKIDEKASEHKQVTFASDEKSDQPNVCEGNTRSTLSEVDITENSTGKSIRGPHGMIELKSRYSDYGLLDHWYNKSNTTNRPVKSLVSAVNENISNPLHTGLAFINWENLVKTKTFLDRGDSYKKVSLREDISVPSISNLQVAEIKQKKSAGYVGEDLREIKKKIVRKSASAKTPVKRVRPVSRVRAKSSK